MKTALCGLLAALLLITSLCLREDNKLLRRAERKVAEQRAQIEMLNMALSEALPGSPKDWLKKED